MNIEEKYAKLRKAAIELLDVPDDKGVLLSMAQALNTAGAKEHEDGVAALGLIVALIETHGEGA